MCESTIKTATRTAPPRQYNHPSSVFQDGSYPATPQSTIKQTNNPNNNNNNVNNNPNNNSTNNNNMNNNNTDNNTNNNTNSSDNTVSKTKDDELMTNSYTDNSKISADDYITSPVG